MFFWKLEPMKLHSREQRCFSSIFLYLSVLTKKIKKIIYLIPKKFQQYLILENKTYSIFIALKILFLSILASVLFAFTFAITSSYFELHIPLSILILVCMIIEVIRMIPLSVQGIGVRESAFVILLIGNGYNNETLFTIALISYGALTLALMLCMPISFIINKYNVHNTKKNT